VPDEASTPNSQTADDTPHVGRRLVYVLAAALTLCAIVGVLLPGFHVATAKDFPSGVSNILDERIRDFHRSSPTTPVVSVVMAVRDPNPTTRTIPLLVTALFYDQSLPTQPTFVDRRGQSVIDPATGSIKPMYAADQVQISLFAPFSGEVKASFPLKDIVEDPARALTTTVNLPADARPQSFPNDTYQFDTNVDIELPAGVAPVMDRGNGPKPVVFLVAAGFAPDETLVDWRLTSKIAPIHRIGATAIYFTSVDASLGRPLSYHLFVYGVAFVPLLLGLSFVTHQLNRRARGMSDTGGGIEVAAALLALLALRQVLVPGDINGITLLDKILGIELVVFSSLAAIMFTRSPAPVVTSSPASATTTNPAPATAPSSPVPVNPARPPHSSDRPRKAWTIAAAVWVGLKVLRQWRRPQRPKA
jgi:hypothetical protein